MCIAMFGIFVLAWTITGSANDAWIVRRGPLRKGSSGPADTLGSSTRWPLRMVRVGIAAASAIRSMVPAPAPLNGDEHTPRTSSSAPGRPAATAPAIALLRPVKMPAPSTSAPGPVDSRCASSSRSITTRSEFASSMVMPRSRQKRASASGGAACELDTLTTTAAPSSAAKVAVFVRSTTSGPRRPATRISTSVALASARTQRDPRKPLPPTTTIALSVLPAQRGAGRRADRATRGS